MPEISRFFGIIIAMYYNDHEPPHFHARYGSKKAKILIDPPTLMAGDLPPRALGMVMEWAALASGGAARELCRDQGAPSNAKDRAVNLKWS
jgi:Domain of unknown function (DUF4160)